MSKKLLIVLVVISMVSFIFASPFSSTRTNETGTKVAVALEDISSTAKNVATPATDDLFDEQFQFPCDPGSVGQAGVESDGQYIYTTIWSAAGFCRYDLDGTFLGEFTIAGASNVRDLAYDGEYFYGGAASNTVFIMDFTNEVLVGTISAPIAVRAIGYDEAADGFWANNWSDEITLFDRNGAFVNSFPCTTHSSYYGFAYDDVTSGGPYLWGASQDGNGSDIVQIEIATGAETGVMFDASGFGSAGGICGGLYITDEIVPGFWTLGGIVQNETIWGVELAVAADPEAPGAPTDFVVTPDANGGLSADLGWFNPSLNIVGGPLTELTEINVFVNGELVQTFNNPTIGGFLSYTANVAAAGNYTFTVEAVNTFDIGGSASGSAYIGYDCPNAVTDAVAVYNDPVVDLTWVNPTTGLNGGPFAGVDYVVVTRNDGPSWTLGAVESYTDNTVAPSTSYTYDIYAGNAIGDGPIATTNSAYTGAGYALPAFPEQAVYPNNPNEYSDSWADLGWCEVVANGGVVTGDVTIVGEWESLDYASEGSLWIMSPSGNDVQVYQSINTTPIPDFEVSTDAFVGEAASGQWIVHIVDSWGDGGHQLQNGMMMITTAVATYGTIAGHVTLDNLRNVEDVTITAGQYTTNPDANGDYELTDVLTGNYTVNAVLDGYQGDSEDVVVVENQVVTADFTLIELDGYWEGVNDGIYSDGIGLTSGGTFQVAFLLEASTDFGVGDAINGIRFWINEAPGLTINVQITAVNNGVPGDLLFEEAVPTYTPDMMYEHMFTTPFITEADAYFVGYSVTHDAGVYPAGLSETLTPGYGDWIALDGVWDQLSILAPGLGGDWLIDAFIGGGGVNPPVLYGDVDGNGEVQAFDAATTLQASVGMITFTPEQIVIGDVDGNGTIQAFDASLILQYSVGIITIFPVEEMRTVSPVADVKVSVEGNELVFTTTGNLYGFDVVAEGVNFGNASTDMLFAQNNNAVAVASAEAVTGEFLRIPFTTTGDAVLNLVINNTEEVVTLDAPKFNRFTGNYPNPFNPTTYFGVELASDAKVTINVYNVKGAKVETINETLKAGTSSIKWDASNNASGVYFYNVNINGNVTNGKMLLLK